LYGDVDADELATLTYRFEDELLQRGSIKYSIRGLPEQQIQHLMCRWNGWKHWVLSLVNRSPARGRGVPRICRRFVGPARHATREIARGGNRLRSRRSLPDVHCSAGFVFNCACGDILRDDSPGIPPTARLTLTRN